MSNTINGCGSGNCACKSAASVQRRDPFDETDYGTPLRHADVDVTLEIDGQNVTVPAGPRRDRRQARLAGIVHDARRSGHESTHAKRQAAIPAPQRDGALYLRS